MGYLRLKGGLLLPLALVALVLLAACDLVAAPTPTPAPTATLVPTATPQPTATPLPSATPVPTSSPTPSATPTETPSPLPTPTETATATPVPVPTETPVPTAPPAGNGPPVPLPDGVTLQQIDAFIDGLSPAQQIGQLLMFPVYADAYNDDYDTYLQQYQIANAIMFNDLDNGGLKPQTLAEFRQLAQDVVAHAPNKLIIATDLEGGIVDRLAPYYGRSPSPADLAASGDPQQAYNQAQTDAGRLLDIGINVDFAPLADVDQGSAIGTSRMFGATPEVVTQFAGAFLDGLQQNGVIGTLKHWPGLGAAAANPDYSLPTIDKSQEQLQAFDFVTFRDLLSHNPGMIMVTHVMEPAYDATYPASLSPVLVDGVLRGQLGYGGVVVSDALAAGAIGEYMKSLGFADPAQAVGEATVLAILAGEDIVECPNSPDQIAAMVDALNAAVQSGRITPERLRLSLQRIIALKVGMGLIALS